MSYRRQDLFFFKFNDLQSSFRHTEGCFSYQEIFPQCSTAIFRDAEGDFHATRDAAFRRCCMIGGSFPWPTAMHRP
jgi:hypothetical protein